MHAVFTREQIPSQKAASRTRGAEGNDVDEVLAIRDRRERKRNGWPIQATFPRDIRCSVLLYANLLPEIGT